MISLFKKTDKTKNKKLRPEYFLIKNDVLKNDYTTDQNFPMNLTRDTHIRTVRDIVFSMVEYAEYVRDNNYGL